MSHCLIGGLDLYSKLIHAPWSGYKHVCLYGFPTSQDLTRKKKYFSPGIHLFNQFFAAWSSIYSRMVEFQLRKCWSTLKAAVALKALRFWYPDLEIFKYIFWDQTGDISGNIQEAWPRHGRGGVGRKPREVSRSRGYHLSWKSIGLFL